MNEFLLQKKFALMHRSRYMVHVQWLQTHCQCHPIGDVRTHNSRTNSHRSSNLVHGLIMWPAMGDLWPRSKGQRSRSQGHV